MTPRSLTRREAVARMLAAAGTISLLDLQAFGVPGLPTGIGSDPNLRKKIIPWERVLTEAEMKTVTALAARLYLRSFSPARVRKYKTASRTCL